MQCIIEITEKELQNIIPKFSPSRHKGQNGKIGVIGGSFEYTGAPFYAAEASLKGGGDLAHIFCTEKAGTPIKSYSPEVIVHPYLLSQEEMKRKPSKEEVENCVNSITKWYQALHAVVIGPGFGRDDVSSEYVEDIFSSLKDHIAVCDADFLWFISEKNKESLIEKIKQRSKLTILTPNEVEFSRLWKYFKGDEEQASKEAKEDAKKQLIDYKADVLQIPTDNPLAKDASSISQLLNNTTILKKGDFDVMTNGRLAYIVKKEAAQKRAGGQGDILCGLAALYSYWDLEYQKSKGLDISKSDFHLLTGCALACYVAKGAGKLAFDKLKYGLTAPAVMDEVPNMINSIAYLGEEQIKPKF